MEIKKFNVRPEQLRAARNLLAWSVTTVCEKSGMSADDLMAAENDPRGGVCALRLEGVYRSAGITFKMFSGLDGQIYKTRLGDGPWHYFTRRGPSKKESTHGH
jgi:hypothetical protein